MIKSSCDNKEDDPVVDADNNIDGSLPALNSASTASLVDRIDEVFSKDVVVRTGFLSDLQSCVVDKRTFSKSILKAAKEYLREVPDLSDFPSYRSGLNHDSHFSVINDVYLAFAIAGDSNNIEIQNFLYDRVEEVLDVEFKDNYLVYTYPTLVYAITFLNVVNEDNDIYEQNTENAYMLSDLIHSQGCDYRISEYDKVIGDWDANSIIQGFSYIALTYFSNPYSTFQEGVTGLNPLENLIIHMPQNKLSLQKLLDGKLDVKDGLFFNGVSPKVDKIYSSISSFFSAVRDNNTVGQNVIKDCLNEEFEDPQIRLISKLLDGASPLAVVEALQDRLRAYGK